MQITLNQLLDFPNEPFYSHIKNKYGENSDFDPIKIIDEVEGTTTDNIFEWIEWLNWHLQIKDFVDWNNCAGNYVNKHINSCTDANVLYWLMLNNPEVRNEHNLKHYINLYDQNKDKKYPDPFALWSIMPKIQNKHWSEYFFVKQFQPSAKPYSTKVLVQNIPNLKPGIKTEFLTKFIEMPHSSYDIMRLLLIDDSLQTEENYAYFRSLSPKPYEICRLLLQRAQSESPYSYCVESDSFNWFLFYVESNGDIYLLIYTMNRILREIANFKCNKFFWSEFLTYLYPDLNHLDTIILDCENLILKNKWNKLKHKVFEI